MSPNELQLLKSMPWYKSSPPQVWAGFNESFLANKMWQRGWDVISEIWYKKAVASNLGAFSHSLAHCEGSQLPCSELPSRDRHLARNWGRPWPVAREELNPANNMWANLEADSSPVEPSDGTPAAADTLIAVLWEALSQGQPAVLCPNL